MTTRTEILGIVSAARGVLSRALNGEVGLRLASVVVEYPGAANLILRCRLDGRFAAKPETVIVKRSNKDPDPLRNEWAGLEFLNGLETVRCLVPRLWGGDARAGLLVLEDLGLREDGLLGEVLEGRDPDRAEAALLEMQRSLARLHAGTVGREKEYVRICERRGASGVSRHRVHRIAQAIQVLPEILKGLDIALPGAATEELRGVREVLAAPGPFLTYTHGDGTPANAFFDGESIRLFDLETGGYRHALLDGCYARLRYLHSVWAQRIPIGVQRRMFDAYRDELWRAGVEGVHEDGFLEGYLACCAGWLAGLLCFLPTVRDTDQRWGRSTYRQRIVAGLEHFVALCQEWNRMNGLAEAAETAGVALRRGWGEQETAMPVHPAFRS